MVATRTESGREEDRVAALEGLALVARRGETEKKKKISRRVFFGLQKEESNQVDGLACVRVGCVRKILIMGLIITHLFIQMPKISNTKIVL